MSAPLVLLLALLASAAFAQEPAPSPTPLPLPSPAEVEEPATGETPPETTPSPSPEPTASPGPPGSFRVGRLYVIPRLRIDTIGIDTNVNDTTQEEPRTDFLAIGGPSLELLLPLRRTVRLSAQGHVSYVYYADTPSQRRYLGGGDARLGWDTGRTSVELGVRDDREYRRLDEEIEQRVEQRTREARVSLRRRILGRIGLRGGASLAERSLPDLRERTEGLAVRYDRNELTTTAGVDYSLTYKTRLLVEVERQQSVFDDASERDGRFEGVRGGVEADASALISGRLIFGRRRLVLDQDSGQGRPTFNYLEFDPTLNVSSRTRIGVFFRQDQAWSVLSDPDAPIVNGRRWGAHLYRELFSRIEMTARAERQEFERDLGTDRRDEVSGEILYRWRRFAVGFRGGHVQSPRGAFFRQRAFEGSVGGLVVRYR